MKNVVGASLALALGIGIGFTPYYLGAQDKTTPLDGLNKEAVERIIHDYLMENPEVIIQAVEGMRQRQEEQAEAARVGFLAAEKQRIYYSEDDHVTGNADGDLVIVEFFDYRCGYCKSFHPTRDRLLEIDPNIRFVLKEFPVLGEESLLAARAAVASRKQGKYLEFHDALMETRGRLNMASIQAIAEEVGLDVDQLGADMQDEDINRVLANNARLARALDINGTPGFIVGDRIVPGAISLPNLHQLVGEARTTCKENAVC